LKEAPSLVGLGYRSARYPTSKITLDHVHIYVAEDIRLSTLEKFAEAIGKRLSLKIS